MLDGIQKVKLVYIGSRSEAKLARILKSVMSRLNIVAKEFMYIYDTFSLVNPKELHSCKYHAHSHITLKVDAVEGIHGYLFHHACFYL